MTTSYIYRTAVKSDKKPIIKFLETYFVHDEPSVRATNLSVKELHPIFKEVVKRCLKHPLSTVVTTEHGEVVGVLLNSVWKREEFERDKTQDEAIGGLSETMLRYLKALQKFHDEYWSLVPSDVNTVIYRELSSVGKPWQHQGIATEMLARSRKAAKLFGVDGVVPARPSHANKPLLA